MGWLTGLWGKATSLKFIGPALLGLVGLAVFFWGMLQKEKRTTDRQRETIRTHEVDRVTRERTTEARNTAREEGSERVEQDVAGARSGRRDHFESQ